MANVWEKRKESRVRLLCWDGAPAPSRDPLSEQPASLCSLVASFLKWQQLYLAHGGTVKIKWINPLKWLEPCLAYSLCSINVSGYSLCSPQLPWCWFGPEANTSFTESLEYLETGKQLPLPEKSHPQQQHIWARAHNLSDHMVGTGNQEKSLGCYAQGNIISILHTLHTSMPLSPSSVQPQSPQHPEGLAHFMFSSRGSEVWISCLHLQHTELAI